MASLTNAYTAGIGLPDGRLIPPGGTVDKVDAATLKHPVIVARIKAGDLKQDGATEADDEGDEGGKPEIASLTDDELRTFLGERGVKADGRWSRERLLTEAEKVQA